MPFQALENPLASHILTHLRHKETPTTEYRGLTRILTHLLVAEGAKHLPTRPQEIETPLEPMTGSVFATPIVGIPILRAGLGMLDAFMDMIPSATVGYIGLQRNEETAIAETYYCKLPPLEGAVVFLLDPMLATGGSALWAIRQIATYKPHKIVMLCAVAAPEGVALLTQEFPTLEIVAGALDKELNAKKYICPGLGDFGDRLFGTH